MRLNGQTSSNFTLTNNATAEFDSGPKYRICVGIEGQNKSIERVLCFVIFWGAKNIAGECSLKIPYSTIAVNWPKFKCFFPFSYSRGFWKIKIKNWKIRCQKNGHFCSKHEPQINWTNAYDINLDATSSGLAWNGSIYLLSTPTSNLGVLRITFKNI